MFQSTPDSLSIDYHAAFPALIARWKRTTLAPALHDGYAAMLDAAAAHARPYWLIDIRYQPLVSPEGVRWMMSDFYPRMHARLDVPVYLAYLMAPHQLAHVLSNPEVPLLTVFDDLPYRLERFTDEQAALDWLLYCYQNDLVAGR